MRGCASGIPDSPDASVVASSPTGDPNGPHIPTNSVGDTDASFGDWYGGHELAHTFGRCHPGFCNGNSSDDDNFPNPNGQISDNRQTYVGLDFGDVVNGEPKQIVISPFAFDIMTYCNQPQWLSAYAYEGVFDGCARERFRQPVSGTGDRAGLVPAALHPANEAMVGDFLSVVASVDSTRKTERSDTSITSNGRHHWRNRVRRQRRSCSARQCR